MNGHARKVFAVGFAITVAALFVGGCGKATCRTRQGFLGTTRKEVLIDLLKVGLDDPDRLVEFCEKHEDTVYSFAEPEECVILERQNSKILCIRPKGKDIEVWTIEPWVEIE